MNSYQQLMKVCQEGEVIVLRGIEGSVEKEMVAFHQGGEILLETPGAYEIKNRLEGLMINEKNQAMPYIDESPCGKILIEKYLLPPHIILCGAGHVSVEIAALANYLEMPVTVMDERAEFANEERFPQADIMTNIPLLDALTQLAVDGNPY